MQRRRHIDVGGKSVVGNRAIVASGKRCNLHGSGEAAAAGEVHLYHVALTFGDQTAIIFEAILFFPRRNAKTRSFAQPVVAFVIVRSERFLQPERIVLLEVPRPAGSRS